MKRIAIVCATLVAVLVAGFLVGAEPPAARNEGPPRPPGEFPDGPPSPPATPQAPPGSQASQQIAKLSAFYTLEELNNGVYVGSEFCIACHGDYAGWRDTRHAQALRRPLPRYSLIAGKGVVADFDNNGVDDFRQGLDFNQISSVFDPFKPNAPILGYGAGGYTITIGQLTMPVVCTQGGTGEWKQRYLLRVPVIGTPDGLTAENYVSPVQYNEKTRGYVLYHPEAWYDEGNQPRYAGGTPVAVVAAENGRTYSKKCIGCHTTGIRGVAQDVNGEWRYKASPAVLFAEDDPGYFDYDHDGVFDLINIGCESCHGPGSPHILGGGDPSRIVNPEDLSSEKANEVCGQCHSRVKSVPNGTHDWPYLDDVGQQWFPGQDTPLTDYFTDASGRWPDGINSRQHHQQWLDFIESPKPGFQYHPVRCSECHDAHGDTSNDRLIRDVLVEGGIPIATQTNNNTLCLACHAGFGPFSELSKPMIADFDDNFRDIREVVEKHTFHPWGAERSMGLTRCVECHMPKIAKSAINYDIRSHVFEAIPPEKTLTYQDQGGMPNSCAVSCHSLKVNTFGFGIDSDIGAWNQGFDRRTAGRLERFFGPGGRWWDTAEEGATARNRLLAAEPGEVAMPAEEEED